MRIKTRHKIICGPLPLVPMVNVVFLLLIFFMISNSLVFWPGTTVETTVQLPRARISSMRAADKLVITITRAEKIFFNDMPVQPDDLERLLKEQVLNSKRAAAKRLPPAANAREQGARAPLVVLRADKSIPYEKIVDVISLARSLDLWVYLVTDSRGDARRSAARLVGEGVE